MKRLLPLLLGALCLGAYASVKDVSVDSARWTNQFDPHFRKYAKRYFGPHFDWRWFKAQGIAESRLRPEARSAVGAVGIMQILPSTFEEIKGVNPTFKEINEPKWNIAAGIFYDRHLYRKWKGPMPERDRLFLALAGYNAGYGGVLKAYKRTRKENPDWQEIESRLPRETRNYVGRINKLMHGKGRRLRGLEKYLANEN
ncbi:MAG: transglycosylase SLT domain-containing protein [Pseudomonadota bacterium]|nr:transglycosylase SLT domain-containing protein [Pseudomonadota bacterium]